MSSCEMIHKKLNELPRYSYPFSKEELPKNGVYIIFENNESGHGNDRVVHIGTHRSEDGLIKRIYEIFENENKNRSILRKNIGRSILNKDNNPYLEIWDKDTTSRKIRDEYEEFIDNNMEKKIEKIVTLHITNKFSFVIVEEEDQYIRNCIKDELISEISRCNECKPSENWLGNYSTKGKIKDSGLWNEQGLYKEKNTNYTLDKI